MSSAEIFTQHAKNSVTNLGYGKSLEALPWCIQIRYHNVHFHCEKYPSPTPPPPPPLPPPKKINTKKQQQKNKA